MNAPEKRDLSVTERRDSLVALEKTLRGSLEHFAAIESEVLDRLLKVRAVKSLLDEEINNVAREVRKLEGT